MVYSFFLLIILCSLVSMIIFYMYIDCLKFYLNFVLSKYYTEVGLINIERLKCDVVVVTHRYQDN